LGTVRAQQQCCGRSLNGFRSGKRQVVFAV
jgi:hypothetical protein